MIQHRRDFLRKSAAFSLLLSHPALAAQAKRQLSRLASYDALGLADLIKRKQVSPLELVDDVIRRVERVNPKINAVLTKNLDFERVRDRARKGAFEGTLGGVPVMLKNLQHIKTPTSIPARVCSPRRLQGSEISPNKTRRWLTPWNERG